jgi:hypothetical protein
VPHRGAAGVCRGAQGCAGVPGAHRGAQGPTGVPHTRGSTHSPHTHTHTRTHTYIHTHTHTHTHAHTPTHPHTHTHAHTHTPHTHTDTRLHTRTHTQATADLSEKDIAVDRAASHLSKRFGAFETMVGGGGGGIGFYGTLRCVDLVVVWRAWLALYGGSACVLDLGSGLGHAIFVGSLVWPAGTTFVGVEIDPIKMQKTMGFLSSTYNELGSIANTQQFKWKVIDVAARSVSLDGFTHVLLVWEGFDERDKAVIGSMVERSTSVRSLCIVQKGAGSILVEMMKLGFPPLYAAVPPIKVMMQGGNTTMYAHLMQPVEREEVGEAGVTPVHVTRLLDVTPFKGHRA